ADLAFLFLDRFHGASRTRGNRLTGLFTRYIYLQAKGIIDKHGWLSPKPITLSNHKGYIRAVAVRLIFYCRYNDYTEEVQRFIGEGFEKLRYNAVEQYPHCGMLWAHVATVRCKAVRERFFSYLDDFVAKKKAPAKNSTATDKESKTDREQAEVPENDRFLDIGSVHEQAAFAIGAFLHKSDITRIKNEEEAKCKHRLIDPVLGRKFIEGILYTSDLNMGVMMRYFFACNRDNLNTIKQLVKPLYPEKTMDEFLGKAVRLMICYGQHQDASRFENYYLNEKD
ncbi:hypothetical protein PFISCL1PPCAC_25957, partial [Pristionchus fissidentatus]